MLLIGLIVLMAWVAFSGLGYYIACEKNRSPIEGALIGFLFGPVGCLWLRRPCGRGRSSSRIQKEPLHRDH